MVWLDSGSIPLSSTDYTGSRQTSRSRPYRLCKQRHGLRGTSDDVFLQTAGTLPAVFVVGKGKRKGNHAMLGSDAQEVAPMSTLVSIPKVAVNSKIGVKSKGLGSIPRGWAREVRYGRHRVGAHVPNLH